MLIFQGEEEPGEEVGRRHKDAVRAKKDQYNSQCVHKPLDSLIRVNRGKFDAIPPHVRFPACSGQCVAKIHTFVHSAPHFIPPLPNDWKLILTPFKLLHLPALAFDFSACITVARAGCVAAMEHSSQTFTTMNDLLYVIAVILIIGWLLGAFVFSVGSIIHLLLVIAIIAVLLRLIRGRSV
jgi:hypothetical protein